MGTTAGHTTTNLREGRLHVTRVGDGPAVIALHGGPYASHGYLLEPLVPLSVSHLVTLYDQRGGGKSPRFESLYPDVAAWESDLTSVYDTLEPGPVTILGHSWGAFVALAFALRRVRPVDRLVLINVIPPKDPCDFLFEALLRGSTRSAVVDVLDTLQEAPPQWLDLAARVVPLFVHPERWWKLFGDVDADLSDKADEIAVLWNQLGALVDTCLGQQPRLDIPVLVVQGDTDVAPMGAVRGALARLRNPTFIELANCGHVAPLEAPQELARHVQRFLAS